MTPEEALSRWNRSGPLRPAPDPGLINRTWLVGEPPAAVLQKVSPLFDPRVHLDIDAVTRHLADAHLPTPRMIATASGDLWVGDGTAGSWRLMTYVPGRTLHRATDARTAASAGDLVGRFHHALADLGHEFQAPRRFAHDTRARMAELRAALDACEAHPLRAAIREVGREVLERWDAWEGDLDLPLRVAHGDLKISNLRFAADGELALCLIDLDTVGPMPLPEEMGDAWRSWCNRGAEDDPEAAAFDLGLFEASARAWAAHCELLPVERRNLVPGVERICLELAGRFAADAVRLERFREDRDRWPEPGRHNLLRARGQLRLARSVAEVRGEMDRIVDRLPVAG